MSNENHSSSSSSDFGSFLGGLIGIGFAGFFGIRLFIWPALQFLGALLGAGWELFMLIWPYLWKVIYWGGLAALAIGLVVWIVTSITGFVDRIDRRFNVSREKEEEFEMDIQGLINRLHEVSRASNSLLGRITSLEEKLAKAGIGVPEQAANVLEKVTQELANG